MLVVWVRDSVEESGRQAAFGFLVPDFLEYEQHFFERPVVVLWHGILSEWSRCDGSFRVRLWASVGLLYQEMV